LILAAPFRLLIAGATVVALGPDAVSERLTLPSDVSKTSRPFAPDEANLWDAIALGGTSVAYAGTVEVSGEVHSVVLHESANADDDPSWWAAWAATDGSVQRIVDDGNGGYWVGTDQGLGRVSRTHGFRSCTGEVENVSHVVRLDNGVVAAGQLRGSGEWAVEWYER
jgi:hypothetical protein